jgi:hypothetical protein
LVKPAPPKKTPGTRPSGRFDVRPKQREMNVPAPAKSGR